MTSSFGHVTRVQFTDQKLFLEEATGSNYDVTNQLHLSSCILIPYQEVEKMEGVDIC